MPAMPNMEKKGGYPAGSKPATELTPPPASVVKPSESQSTQPAAEAK